MDFLLLTRTAVMVLLDIEDFTSRRNLPLVQLNGYCGWFSFIENVASVTEVNYRYAQPRKHMLEDRNYNNGRSQSQQLGVVFTCPSII